ncbi:neuronal cell adhesion molecule-like [Ptychodera flava]|uniref:neuronal cell adhesion molecule-like n=1 Tax=Ptychodera flava TaxID=63121 RepID=UPI00396A54D0
MANKICLLVLAITITPTLSQELSPPSIVEVSEQEVYVNPRSEYAILKCVATGNPSPTYRWEIHGQEVRIDGEFVTLEEGTLKIKNPTSRKNDGKYQCFATNFFGTALSQKISLTVGHLGRFPLSDKQKQSFHLYSVAKLECKPPSGTPPPRVFWSSPLPKVLKYSDRINQDPDGNLVFSNILESDNGGYFCNAITDFLGELRQAPVIYVKVKTPGECYHAVDGSDYRGNVSMTDNMNTCQEWTEQSPQSHSRTPENYPNAGLGEHNYCRNPDGENKAWCYTTDSSIRREFCDIGQPDEYCEIPVEQRAPVLIYHPEQVVTVLMGKTMKLKCLADAYPTPKINWERVDEEMPVDRASTESFGQTLVVEKVDFSDEGLYNCSAENGINPGVWWLVRVRVEAAPYWEETPRDKTIPPWSNYTMECNAGGIPPPNIKWLENGNEIPVPDTNQRRNVKGNQITFIEAMVSDTSVYQCIAENIHGEIMTSLYLYVHSIPAEIRPLPPTIIYGVTGKSVSIDCKSFGLPEPTITWTFDGRDLSDDRYQILSSGTLIISNIDTSDGGQYTCTTKNHFGRDGACVTVRVRAKDVPSAPLNVKIENATDSELDLIWSPSEPNNSPIKVYIIQYATAFTNFTEWKTLMEERGDQNKTTVYLSPWVPTNSV